MGAILTVDNINVYYGSIHAIKGISFEVNAGEIVTLIGANGAGKSTTLNTISGLLRSRTGSIHFNGEDLGKLPPHKTLSKGLALVPEGRRIFLQMTVQENLDMGAYIRKNNIKPELVLEAFYSGKGQEFSELDIQIQREEVYGNTGDEEHRVLTPLEDFGEDIE